MRRTGRRYFINVVSILNRIPTAEAADANPLPARTRLRPIQSRRPDRRGVHSPSADGPPDRPGHLEQSTALQRNRRK